MRFCIFFAKPIAKGSTGEQKSAKDHEKILDYERDKPEVQVISLVIMFGRFAVLAFTFLVPVIGQSEGISPYKFTDKEDLSAEYVIPASSRFQAPRLGKEEPDAIYYFSPPKEDLFPIAILCTGSSSKGDLSSVIRFHRYFLQELSDLGLGVLTVEQWGVDGNKVDEEEFFAHYTRSQRLKDHLAVVQHLEKNPPLGWNGQFIFIGASEGGPIVTELTTVCSNTLATINWSGAGDWSWADQLWQFCQHWKQKSWLVWAWDLMPRWMPFSPDIPRTRPEYNSLVQQIVLNPTSDQWMLGMTYLYHADAFQWPIPKYEKIRSPFLVVSGTEDSIIESSDQFVEKANAMGAPITYFRIEGMDHYVRRRPDILQSSFAWLKQQLR